MHSPYAPSSAFRWVACPGSVQLAAKYPETAESESAAEGTAAHWVGTEWLQGRTVAENTQAPNGLIVTEEMHEAATMWADDVRAVGLPAEHLQIEQRLEVPRIHPDCGGRPDVWVFDQAAGVLYIWEFKYGHTLVEAYENWQNIVDACGILDLLGVDGRNDQHITVDMRVVQPRAYHPDGRIRSWRVKASDLRGYFNIAHAAAHGEGTRAGTHCLHCPARHACPTLRRATLAAMDYVGAAVPEELPPDAMGEELALLQHLAALVQARLTGRETEVEAALRAGQRVPGWTLEQTYGRLEWNVDVATVATTGDMLGVDLRKPVDVITPTQAKKKGVDAAVIAAYSHTPKAGVKLAPDTQLNNKARAAFGAK